MDPTLMRFLLLLLTATALISPALSSAPDAPRLIAPTDGALTSDSTPTIQWIGDVHDSYQARVNTSQFPDNGIYWDSGQSGAAGDWCDSGTLAEGTYHVFVRLRNSSGWSAWSAPRSVTVSSSARRVKKGWVLIRDDSNTDDIQYHQRLFSKAREYHVNHVQLSHSIMMYTWEPAIYPTRRQRINNLIQLAHNSGVEEVVLWVHDIQDNKYRPVPASYKTTDGKINLDLEAFWMWLAGEYEKLFRDHCPNADGLVFTFSENFIYGGADVDDRTMTQHTGKTPEDSYLKMIQTIWDVCKRYNKSLYVRTWANGGADRGIRNAIIRTNEPGIWMMSKATGAGDWNVIQEDYDIIGSCTGHPEMVEFDVVGEYWGLTWTPWCGIGYIKHLWTDFALPRGGDGVVARIEREDDTSNAPGIHPRSLDCTNRINMYALDILADYPDIPVGDIYDYWCRRWFGPDAADRAASALKRTFDISNACYNLPMPGNGTPNYSFSKPVARDYCLQSLFDVSCVSSKLASTDSFFPGSGQTNYDVLRAPLVRAAGRLSLTVPDTFFGGYTYSYNPDGSADCSVTVVDPAYGLSAGGFSVKYSTNGVSFSNFTGTVEVVPGDTPTSPYTVTARSIPFGGPAAGRNKVRFTAVNLKPPSGSSVSKDYTVCGLSTAFATLGSSVTSDGITDPLNGSNTVSSQQDGRQCRRLLGLTDPVFYLQVDDGFAYDRIPQMLYISVDYFGAAGSITPVYDSVERTDETLTPVYLNGGSGWRTATWRLDNVNFGNRLVNGADLHLRVSRTDIYVSGVKLHKNPPPGMLARPENIRAVPLSTTDIKLTWDAVPAAVKYQVCKNDVFMGWAYGTEYVDSNLTPNTQHTYTVTACDNVGGTSCASLYSYTSTLSPTPSVTITSGQPARQWRIYNMFTFNTNGFGSGKTAYYRYAWDESPTHTWTGNEPTWPSQVSPPVVPGWSLWQPYGPDDSPSDMSPSDAQPGWLMYDGSTTQRCMSEAMIDENGQYAWQLLDQGRVSGAKVKLGAWPLMPITKSEGATMVVRMKAADSPLGWTDSSMNFGFNLPYMGEVGVVVRPDRLMLDLPGSSNDPSIYFESDYSYHTYTFTFRNDMFELYRDGVLMLSGSSTSAENGMWSGPFFGHTVSNAVGSWYFQWIAWRSGYYTPTSWDSQKTLLLIAPKKSSSLYLHLQAYNAQGLPNGILDLGPYYYWDGVHPISPTVMDDGAYTTCDSVHFTWSPGAPTVTGYKYAVGNSPLVLDDVLPYTMASPEETSAGEATIRGLNLMEGHRYYVSVRAVNASGDGPAGTTDGIEAAPAYEHIFDVKSVPDGSPVSLYGKTVTALFGDCAYVQESLGQGIRVQTGRVLRVGDMVDIAGVLAGTGLERVLSADTVIASE